MYLPASLYRAMPALYAASGVVLFVAERGNAFGAVSACALTGAGAMTSFWRFRHRAQYDARQTARLAFESRKRRQSGPDVQVG